MDFNEWLRVRREGGREGGREGDNTSNTFHYTLQITTNKITKQTVAYVLMT